MQQAADIRDAVRPDEILFVVDAMIGQDAVNTAQAFLDGVGFDGVVLSKLDGDARGGAALSVAHVTGRQIMFASNGEKLDDFDAFHPDRMASRILGMGDVLSLIEQAEQTFSQAEAEKMAAKLAPRGPRSSRSTTSWPQMEQVRKMGSLSKLLGMLPGMGADQGPDQQPRRAGRRPHGRDHQVDDPGRARTTRRSSTARAAPVSPRAPASRSARSRTWSSGSSRPAR